MYVPYPTTNKMAVVLKCNKIVKRQSNDREGGKERYYVNSLSITPCETSTQLDPLGPAKDVSVSYV